MVLPLREHSEFGWQRRGNQPALQTIISRASSNTTYYRGRVILAVGDFDENLGVGAPYNGGEDTDYALRASYVARSTSFLDAKVIGSPDMFQELKGAITEAP